MSVALILLFVIGGSIAGLVLGVLTLMVWDSNSRRAPAPPSSPSSFKLSFKSRFVWVLGGIVALVVAVWLYSADSLSGLGGVDVNLWIAICILLILAVRGLIKKVSTVWVETAALIIVGGGLLFFGADAPKVWKKVQGGVSSVVLSESKDTKDDSSSSSKQLGNIPAGRNWETKSVVWEELNPDGSILINTPSLTIQIPDYCTVLYSDGNGREYQVLNQGVDGEWEVHQRGDHVAGTGFRIMVTKKGIKEVTYRQSCP
ncbi:hypothetical protein IPH92_02245 [Candidatus Kaiserbacteria bacterium]|nr:MAG: hypothetical protein IPH92_02245 [Candidatus Kaiserbacteria bacterium]